MKELQMTYGIQIPHSPVQNCADHPGVPIAPIGHNWLAHLLLILLLVAYTPAWADGVLQGRVISVAGGNALTFLDAQHREHKIRLAYIETPERGQAFGEEAQTALAALALNREVKVQMVEKAADGSPQAEVISQNGQNVNLELLNRGLAWHDYFERQSAAEREQYQAALLNAQRDRRGMWALDRLELPRDFRAHREQLLRWWLYVIGACAMLLLFSAVYAVYGRRLDIWLAKQDALDTPRAEERRVEKPTSEAAERDRIREIANREMDRLAAERRLRVESAITPSPPDHPDHHEALDRPSHPY